MLVRKSKPLSSRDTKALSKADQYIEYLKLKNQKLKEEGDELAARRAMLEEKMTQMKLTESEKALYREIYMKAEADANRDMKKRLSIDDFEQLTIIGRGAFGEVRLVRMKNRFSKEVYGKYYYFLIHCTITVVSICIAFYFTTHYCVSIVVYSYEINGEGSNDYEESSESYSCRKRHTYRS